MHDRKQTEPRTTTDHKPDADAKQPGKATLVEHDAGEEPLFAGGYEWDDIAPDDPAAEHEAPAAPQLERGPIGRHAGAHSKVIRNYPFGAKAPVVTNLADRTGLADQRPGATQYADGMISIDISTVLGGKPGAKGRPGNYRKAWVLVWRARNGDEKPSADPTGWARVGGLPASAQADITAFQDRQHVKQRTRRDGPGHPAPVSQRTLPLSVQRPETIVQKTVPQPDGKLLEPFRIRGGGFDEEGNPTSTPLANYTHNAPRYGDVIIGVWNPPGSSSGGSLNSASGGIRVFLPLHQTVRLCRIDPIVVPNFDTAVGAGTATWIYVTAQVNHEQIYFWILHSWRFQYANGGPAVDGANFAL